MNRLVRRYPSPSLIVSITALVVALGGASYSATGGNFILGRANSATSQTRLVTPLNGPAFRIDNTSAAASATGVAIVTNAARPPFLVTSQIKVANLNADRLDNFNSTQFSRKTVVSFNLAPRANSAPISLPANQPVLVMGITTSGDRGVGLVTLLRVPGQFIVWNGLESPAIGGITASSDNASGRHIGYIDYDHKVDIQVNSADTVRIHNGDTQAQTGTVTLIW